VSIDNNWGVEYYVIYFALFIPLFVLITGSFGFVKYEILRSKKIKKILSLAPFSNFENKGFRKNNNELVGQINGYYVCAGIEWEDFQKKPVHYFKVLYNPLALTRHITFSEFVKFNEILEQDGFYISPNSIEKTYSKKELAKYHYNDISREIGKMINFLNIKCLDSVSYDEWQESFSKANEIEDKYLSEI
jgi:hypothetical protein